MSGHGAHSHAPASKRGLKIAAWVTGAYFIFEMGVGLYTGSVMVIVDAAHTFSAVGGVVLALVAAKIAHRPATHRQTFGGQRAEIIGALLNGMALLVLLASWGILRDSISILMENAPEEIDVEEVCTALTALDGVLDVHHPHAWTLTSGKHLFSAHLRIKEDASAQRQQEILEKAQSLLADRYGFYFATLQLETFDPDESGARGLDLTRGADHGQHEEH